MHNCLTILLVLPLYMPLVAHADQDTPKVEAAGKTDPFSDALALAVQEHKYLLVAVYQDECEDCTRLDENVFKLSRVAQWIERYAIVIRFNKSESIGKTFADTYRIDTFPTVLFMANIAEPDPERAPGEREGECEGAWQASRLRLSVALSHQDYCGGQR